MKKRLTKNTSGNGNFPGNTFVNYGFFKKKIERNRLSHQKIRIFSVLFLAAALGILLFYSHSFRAPSYLRLSEPEIVQAFTSPAKNPFTDLSVPTQITKIGDTYFLVDCYHNQILYSSSVNTPLADWYVLTDKINRGHTIAGDGTVYLADDTENNRILIFEKNADGFSHTQTFSNIGIRPHYVVYDEPSRRFYALSSMTGELYVFGRSEDSSRVFLEKVMTIPELSGVYVRSFTIDKDEIYFVSGNCNILRARLKDLKILERYPVAESIAGMIQLMHIQDYYYITVSTDLYGSQDYATILRTNDLNNLNSSDGTGWEDIYSYFIGGGTPYYITNFNNRYFLTEHRIPGHSVWSFSIIDNQITSVETLF